MTIHTKRIYRLRSVEESTFATDATGTMSAFEPLEFTAATVSYDLPRPLSNVMQSKMDSASQRVNLIKRATLTVTCNLTGQPARASTGTTHTQSEQGKLLRNWLGGRRLGQGDLVAASSTTSVIELDAIARWEAGAAIAVMNDDGRMVARQIVDVAGGDATVWPVLAAADVPSDNDTAYAAASYYLGPSASDDTNNTSLQFVCEGLATDDRFLLLGGKVTGVTFSLGRNQVAQATYTISFVHWIYGADATTDLTTDTAPLTYDATTNNGLPLTVADSDLLVIDEGGAGTTHTLHADTLSIACSPQWVMVNSTSGPSGCGAVGWARNSTQEVVSGSFTIPFESRAWFSNRDDESWIWLHFQLGSGNSEGCILFNIKAQITNVQPVESSGLSYQRVDFVGGVTITADTTDIDDSPFVMHVF